MDDVEIDWQLLADTFLEEAKEIFAAMETLLMALEATPGDHELLNALFRAAHTLKGSAAMVDYRRVGEVAHHLEGLLQRLRSRDLVASSDVVSVLLQSVDVLREAVRRDRQQDATPHPEAEALKERIAALSQDGQASPAPHAAPADRSGRLARVSRTLRVDVAKLDRLLDLSGEISVARGRFGNLLEGGEAPNLEELLAAHRESDRLYLDLQELIISARMVPIGPTFKQHLRTVRDLAQAVGKQARLELEGEATEVDTAVVEHIRDPLLHMVRNSLDHGIEPPEVRRARGKDPCGVVTLRAFHEAGSIVVEVEDDGGGLPRARIAARGRELGLVRDVEGVSDQEVQRLVFEPGFSTTDEVTDISGRGVGMDVVRRNVESLRGAVDVRSEEGKGTTFSMRLPLTLAIIQGFKVGIAGDTYIVPLDAVVECLELPAGGERGATGFFPLRGKPLPYLRLREHFGVAGAPPERENVLVVRHGAAVAGLAVDVLEGESQSVIKPLGALFHGLPGISGSSILGNGRVALILDVAGLLRELHRRSDGGAARAAEARA